MKSIHTYLSLGSNLSNPSENLDLAAAKLHAHPQIEVLQKSSFYSTPPYGPVVQDNFINNVVLISTSLDPHTLLKACKDIEADIGRVKSQRWGPRLIDIDIVLYDNIVVDTPDLIIPHALMHDRAFVVVPLMELNDDLEIPNRGHIKSIFDSLDTSEIIKQ